MKSTSQITIYIALLTSHFLLAPTPVSAAPLLDWFEDDATDTVVPDTDVKKPADKDVFTGKRIIVEDPVGSKNTPTAPEVKPAIKADVKPVVTATAKPDVALAANTDSDDAKFKSALENVYSNHPQIKAEREALKVAEEGVSQAISGFRPDVSANFSKGRERVGNTAETWNYDDTKSRSLTVNQPIFSGGGTVASYMAAKNRMKAARDTLASTEQQVLFDAIVAYTDVVEKQSVLELNQKNVEVLQKQMDVTNAKFKVGELTLTDVSQAKARLALAQANERQALGDLEASHATYRRTIGYDVEGKIAMPDVPSGIPVSLGEAKEWAQYNNPILKAARHNEKAANNNIYVQGATILPSVSLQGSMVRSNGNSLSALDRVDQDAIKLNVSIPIYQSGAEWSRLREAKNLARQAKYNAMDTNESVVESVNLSWEAYNTSKAIIVSNEAAVEAAETALNGVRKENEFGVRTILDVLNAEQETFSARVNLIRAVRTEKLQAYRLLATVGKLTSNELKLNTQVEDPKERYNSVKYQLLGL